MYGGACLLRRGLARIGAWDRNRAHGVRTTVLGILQQRQRITVSAKRRRGRGCGMRHVCDDVVK